MSWILLRIATDIGGTFTDLVLLDDSTGEIRLSKTSTTVNNPEQGIITAVEKTTSNLSEVNSFIHGSTVVINIVTERKGAKTGLITTKGFRDVLEIGRHNRPDMYNLYYKRPEPLVPRFLRLEANERVNSEGKVLKALDEKSVLSAVDVFRREGIQSIAVCLLNTYMNPQNEIAVGQTLAREYPEATVSLSHKISNEWREFERTSTTVLNAYVSPIARTYIERLESELRRHGLVAPLHIMQSNGGTMTSNAAAERPIQVIESGPVAGVMGAAYLGKRIGLANVISLDMGGTTTKASLVENNIPKFTTEYRIGSRPGYPGYPARIPVVDIVEIGAGGGSIAWIDKGGALRVGPKSAGAQPGPACYGLGGTEPTITDANLVLGRINSEYFLGGDIKLDVNAAENSLAKIAEKIGISMIEVAHGILKIADASMMEAVRLVSIQRGYNPRDFAIVAFGGAGPMHAASLARELQIPKVVIPNIPAHFSAWGMLLSDIRHDLVQMFVHSISEMEPEYLEAIFQQLEAEGREMLAKEGVSETEMRFTRAVDMRYRGQEHTVTVPADAWAPTKESLGKIVKDFHGLHEKRYAFSIPSLQSELVAVRVSTIGITKKPDMAEIAEGEKSPAGAEKAHRRVYFDQLGFIDTPVYERSKLNAANELTGPAVVEEAASTTIVHPSQTLSVDRFSNLIIKADES